MIKNYFGPRKKEVTQSHGSHCFQCGTNTTILIHLRVMTEPVTHTFVCPNRRHQEKKSQIFYIYLTFSIISSSQRQTCLHLICASYDYPSPLPCHRLYYLSHSLSLSLENFHFLFLPKYVSLDPNSPKLQTLLYPLRSFATSHSNVESFHPTSLSVPFQPGFYFLLLLFFFFLIIEIWCTLFLYMIWI